MKTKINQLLLLLLLYNFAYAQNSTAFQDDMNYVFQVNRSYVTTGLLKDYGLQLADVAKFNGTLQTTNMVNRDVWQSLYSSLYFMKFNTNATLPTPASVNTTIASYAATVGGRPVNNIIALHYNYEQFKTNAVTGNLVYVQNGKIYDRANRPTTPYEIKTTFSMTPVLSDLTGGVQLFRFHTQLFFKNVSKTIGSVQIDFGDGLGYRTITLGTDNTVTYTTEGLKTLLFKITYTDATVMHSKSEVSITGIVPTNNPCTNCRYLPDGPDMFPLPQSGFSFPTTISMGTGEAWVYYGGTDRVLDKPLIVVEGFDLSNTKSHETLFEDKFFGHVIIIDGVSKKMYEFLDEKGYDLVFLNFTDGQDDIRRNARLFENLVQWVNQKKAENGSTQQIIVVGKSMGGLVARYGLRDMERQPTPIAHQTKLLCTFDTPHLGANVPMGFQAAVRYTAGLSIGGHSLMELVPKLKEAMGKLTSTGTQQMLKYQWQGTGSVMSVLSVNNTVHNSFMNELSTMGLPQLGGIRNIAIASGSECAANNFSPYTTMLSANLNEDFTGVLRVLATFVLGGPSTEPRSALLFSDLVISGSSLQADMFIRSLPDKQVLPIFSINVRVKVKILFGLITKTITLFAVTRSSTADLLPMDGSSGGIEDFAEYETIPSSSLFSFPYTFFTFIPTPSALNVGSGAVALTTADLTRPYSRAVPPTGTKNIPFANFFTNPLSNEKHVQVTEKNGVWLFNEFEGTPQIFSCPYQCFGASIGPVVTGPNTICNDNAVYTLSNVIESSGVTWEQTPNISSVFGQGTPTYTVTKFSTGNGNVGAVLDGACGPSAPVQVNVRVGGYSSSEYPISGPSSFCTYSSFGYSTNELLGATSYNWFWPSNWTYTSGQGTRFLSVTSGSNPGTYGVGVRVANACDAGGSPYVFQTTITNCSQIAVTVSPNPTSSVLTVEVVEDDPSSTNRVIENVKVLDNVGTELKEWIGLERKAEIGVQDLPKGFCYVKVLVGGEVFTERVVIE